ncbi:MAG: hypothetical protein ACOCTI_04160 [Phycisphaeraceae bacterium]
MTGDGYFDPEGPGEHDSHLLDRGEGENDYVDCPRCGESILAFAESCHHCGTWFEEGEAWQAAEAEAGFPKWLLLAAAVAALVGMLVWLL